MKAITKSGLVGSSGSGDLPGKTPFGTPTTTQSPTMVKGGNIAQKKAGGGTSKPYKMGTWIGGGSSSKLPSTPSFTKSKIKTYGNTKDIKSGKEGIVNGVEYLNDKDAGLIRLGKITGGNASGTVSPVKAVNPVNTENPTKKTVSPVKTENPTEKTVNPVKSVSPVKTENPTASDTKPAGITVKPAVPTNPTNTASPAMPVSGQVSSTASPESGNSNSGIPEDISR